METRNWRFWNKGEAITPVSAPANTVANEVPNKRSIKDVSSYIYRQQLARLKQDIMSWRKAIDEIEQQWYPHRVKIQQLYNDTVLNGHVEACMSKRKRLTLLKEFEFKGVDGKENEELTKLFRKKWFYNFMNYVLDAQAYGYSLIALGDIVDDKFPKLEIIRRANVSPERLNIPHFLYGINGPEFMNPEAKDDFGNSIMDWTAWIDTPSESGINKCGNGYLYKVGLYEIFLRNLLGYNGDFVELYAQPYRVGKTDKTEGPERDALEQALRDMGSSGYALIDPVDEIAFLETALGGTGYKGYDNLEARCEAKISKVILGHASAIDSTPGKLGNPEDVEKALQETGQVDQRFFADFMNEYFIDKLRILGFNIPIGTEFGFKNDKEKQEHRAAENTENLQVAQIAETMKNAGMKMNQGYFEERTGIKFEEIETPTPPSMNPQAFGKKIENSLKKLYAKAKV